MVVDEKLPVNSAEGLTVAWDKNLKPKNTYRSTITMDHNPFFKWNLYDKKV